MRCPRAANEHEAHLAMEKIGTFPLIIRPAFTLGGTGGGIAYNREEFEKFAARRKLNLEQHPLHYLFLDGETSLARDCWRAAMDYAIRCCVDSLPPLKGGE